MLGKVRIQGLVFREVFFPGELASSRLFPLHTTRSSPAAMEPNLE